MTHRPGGPAVRSQSSRESPIRGQLPNNVCPHAQQDLMQRAAVMLNNRRCCTQTTATLLGTRHFL